MLTFLYRKAVVNLGFHLLSSIEMILTKFVVVVVCGLETSVAVAKF